MKLTKLQFNQEWYRLWAMGLLIPHVQSSNVYNVKFTFEGKDVEAYDRVCLKASSISQALERACYAVTYNTEYRPEDIQLHAVYDEEENLLWIDEPYYNIVQKKHEFRGMERREFLKRFGATTAALLYGLRPEMAHGIIPFGFFRKIKGEQLYTTSGSYTWTVPANANLISVVCVGAGGGGVAYNGQWDGCGGGGESQSTGGVGGTYTAGSGGGSGGSNGSNIGGAYGGGGSGAAASASAGGSGAVRIIWGAGRSFPNNAT